MEFYLFIQSNILCKSLLIDREKYLFSYHLSNRILIPIFAGLNSLFDVVIHSTEIKVILSLFIFVYFDYLMSQTIIDFSGYAFYFYFILLYFTNFMYVYYVYYSYFFSLCF